MAITYTYKIKSLQAGTERINKQEFPNAIRAVIWDLIGTDENGKTETLSNITTFLNFKTRHTGSFISYSNLSEDNVVDFIRDVANIDSHKSTIQERFNAIPGAEPQASLNEIMPWYFNGKAAVSGSTI
jgi:hypothetical protein